MTKPNDGRWGLSVSRLKELLRYDPESGIWERLSTRGGEAAGTRAGSRKASGYILIDVDGHRYRAHRLAWLYMTGSWPARQIDHADNNRSNNRWHNLRLADDQQNQANSRKSKNNTSGFKGVYRSHCRGRPWRAKLNLGTKQIHLGSFDTAADAAAAYASAAKEHFKEFARVG